MPGKKSSKKNESSDEATDAAENDGGGKGKMMPALVLSVGLLGAGYFVGGALGGGSSATPVVEAAEAEETSEPKAMGTLVAMDAINVNLADGHFLRIAVSLELSEEKSEYLAAKQKKDKTYTFAVAPAADLLLTTFSGRSMDELSTPEGRDAARQAYAEAIDGVYHGDIVSLYFTEFVMQ